MTQQGGPEPDHTEGSGATMREAVDNIAEEGQSDGVVVPPEEARSGEAPVEQIADDAGSD